MQPEGVVTSGVVRAVGNSSRPALTQLELREIVRHWVGMMKASGLPPEEALGAVKSLVRETIVPRFDSDEEAPDEVESRLAFLHDASQWCIEAYYGRGADE